ncbi:methyltransferase domain-containing protein [Thermopolyspora sp. NPDC052614]|uniref:methyltransferase domain-containing protein n=1 Tax=Thermopolyspora sp. NPDC052614 TaxID=3155682 RepID=UPI003421B286
MSEKSTETSATERLIQVLDALDARPAAARLRQRSYDLLRAEPGDRVIDVGCGTGLAAAELAARGVKSLGLDLDDRMIAEARRRHPDAEFQVADALRLPFGDGELTGYRAERVLHNLPDMPAALAEARRVLAPDGRIVLLGQDWDTFIIDSDDPDLTRTILHARANLVPNPRSARRYRALLLDAGFADVEAEVHTGVFTDPLMLPLIAGVAQAVRAAGAITEEQRAAWIAEQTHRARNDRLFVALPMFVAWARRP